MVQDVKSRLEKAAGGLNGGRVAATVPKFKWPYTSKEVKTVLEELSRHKETINLALTADGLKTMLQALSNQTERSNGLAEMRASIKEIQTRIIMDKDHQKILDFFMPHNSKPNLKMSLRLRHPLTGLWLTEGDEFKQWLRSQNGKLCLSGIPGAGKTALAGLMIEEVLKETLRSTGAGCFFFCDYREPKTQDPANILSSLASQLARQSNGAYEILAGIMQDYTRKRAFQCLQIPQNYWMY
ncbi:hypothetical protein BDW59DRAFT_114182 [Aspergillus cavernicola]|uniref:Nephrocystin 3-like N-terminal domain-containing protein n=1 Tax=Aspergillus cavernicola TaxID=176166 RepID=A0ABR4IW28_9EURO